MDKKKSPLKMLQMWREKGVELICFLTQPCTPQSLASVCQWQKLSPLTNKIGKPSLQDSATNGAGRRERNTSRCESSQKNARHQSKFQDYLLTTWQINLTASRKTLYFQKTTLTKSGNMYTMSLNSDCESKVNLTTVKTQG